MNTMQFLEDAPRYFFFTGKGGVGKTSIACATSIHLVEQGKRVLLVSTDPASNVGQVFGQEVGNRIVEIESVPGLAAMEIDPEQAVEQYRERILGPLRGTIPDDEMAAVQESISGACTTEIASFNEFTGLLTDSSLTRDYDHVVFDTAPTGHTIRLLMLPGAWTDFLARGTGDASCLGPMAGLEKQQAVYAGAVEALADPKRTRLVLVARPQASSLQEISRTHEELYAIGLHRQSGVINGVMPKPTSDDGLAHAVYVREQAAMDAIPENLRALPMDVIPLRSRNMVGVDALQTLFHGDVYASATGREERKTGTSYPRLGALVDELARGDHGLIMLMGKGGVGKTTIAAAVAVALAKAGKKVHLSTTDPAAHLTNVLGEEVDGLTVSRIDPVIELKNYQDHVIKTRGRKLNAEDRAVLEEDLRSPCYEEIAVFQAFSRIIRESRRSFVVMDTAPTGHTLLLMDATGAYHREVERSMGRDGNYTTPLMRLQNPEATKVMLVTLAETTPVLEAAELQDDLGRANITPWAWVVNQSLAVDTPSDPLLAQRADAEVPHIERVIEELSPRAAVVPMLGDEPVGAEALLRLTRNLSPVS